MTAKAVLDLLARQAFTITHEADLQDAIDVLLADLPHEREVRLGPTMRVDFVVAEKVAIEVKVTGGRWPVYRQLTGYADTWRFTDIILATTVAAHAGLPATCGPAALHVALLGSP